MTEALRELIATVEAGTAKASTFADALGEYGPPDEGVTWAADNAYNGSLDAAKALHEAVLPGWRERIERGGADAYGNMRDSSRYYVSLWPAEGGFFGKSGEAADPARAWLIAILKAALSEAEG